ncbi:MAG TPA: DUF448 domain-containing protein [Alphaproteobacteria bacterium]|nr:DUF448 domain-containing protein [Alphaproteobacteria bacterium]
MNPAAAQTLPTRDATPAAAAELRRPLRRCLVTGEGHPKENLLRFVLAPPLVPGGSGEIVPDIEERLPGRGLWVCARRDIVAAAVSRRLFARAARAPVAVASDLDQQVERLLVRRIIALIGLARRSGAAVGGYEKARALSRQGRVGLLLIAAEAAVQTRRKAFEAASTVAVYATLKAAELGEPFGRPQVGHVAIARGRIGDALRRETGRLAGFRAAPLAENVAIAITT